MLSRGREDGMPLWQLFVDGWTLIMGAPLQMIGLMAIAGSIAWWFRGAVDHGKIEGLDAQIEALKQRIAAIEERLRLAADKFQQAMEEKSKAEADLDQMRREIKRGDANVALSTSETATLHIARLGELLGEGTATLSSPTFGVTLKPRKRDDDEPMMMRPKKDRGPTSRDDDPK
jgi:outer membrane murein-binding lipoprotein Lpp